MNWQTLVTGLLVLGAAIYTGRYAWRQWQTEKKGCKKCCGGK